MHSVFLEFLPTLYPTNISAAYIVSAEQTEKSGKITSLQITVLVNCRIPPGGGGALEYFLGGYVPPGTPDWHPVLKKNSPKIDTLFQKWANFLYPVLGFALKLIPRSRNGPISYTPF